MTIKVCVIMDPILKIKPYKDTTFALLLEATKRKWEIYYLEYSDLLLAQHTVFGLASQISVNDSLTNFVHFIEKTPKKIPLQDFDIILMRKDPPFDMPYLYSTYLLELAQKAGCLIINNPIAIRDSNEKLFTALFPQCCPETIVTSQKALLKDFLDEQQSIIVKPLHAMGGHAVFWLTKENPNFNATIEVMTHHGKYPIMAQRYLPEIADGDKRIILIDGKPYPYGLARLPPPGDIRGNLAAGGEGKGHVLTARDYWICEQVSETLQKKGLFLVGLDIIGDYLTEINVTSPTCIREIEAAFGVNLCADILDRMTEKIHSHKLASKIN